MVSTKAFRRRAEHIASESAEVFRIADGKFIGYWCLANVAGLMRQLTEEVPVATSV